MARMPGRVPAMRSANTSAQANSRARLMMCTVWMPGMAQVVIWMVWLSEVDASHSLN